MMFTLGLRSRFWGGGFPWVAVLVDTKLSCMGSSDRVFESLHSLQHHSNDGCFSLISFQL